MSWIDGLHDVLDHLERYPAGERWEVIRTGPREPIKWGTRLAILLRDGNECQRCERQLVSGHNEIHIDHLVPWSAGGSDRSDNLRVLCQPCNEARSNYRDGDEVLGRYLPVTWWCIRCWAAGMVEEEHPFGVSCSSHFCGYRPSDASAFQRRVTQGSVAAYCAHCRRGSWTDVTL